MNNEEIVQLLPEDKRLKAGESAASWIARIMNDPALVKDLVLHQLKQQDPSPLLEQDQSLSLSPSQKSSS